MRPLNPAHGILLAAILGLTITLPALAVDDAWVERWRQDIRELTELLPEIHPNPYDKISRAELEGDFQRLIDRLPELEHHQIVVELARLIARLEDGHSRVTLPLPEDAGFFLGHSKTPPTEIPGLIFRPLPLRLYVYDDGLFVQRIAVEHAKAAGAKVERIGRLTAEEAIAAVSPVVHRDNRLQLLYQLPDYLVLPEVLHTTGVIDEVGPVDLEVVLGDGSRTTLRLEPVQTGQTVTWADARGDGPPPLYLRDVERHFWFEYLEDERAVYFQYNVVYNEKDETLAGFAERLFDFIDANPVDKLIIDLRLNRGGNGSLNQPLVHGLIRSTKLQRPGSLFAITGRGTFSAAMMFTADLEEHTPVLFAGEPTGSLPNHYGDSRKTRLPRSGLTVRLSTLYWQLSDPRDVRQAFSPHLPTTFSSADYRSDRDPALETILRSSREPVPPPAGSWLGRAVFGHEDMEFTIVLEQPEDWTGTIALPGRDTPQVLEAVEVDGENARFELPMPWGRIHFQGWREGGQIYGEARAGGGRYPFVLSKRSG